MRFKSRILPVLAFMTLVFASCGNGEKTKNQSAEEPKKLPEVSQNLKNGLQEFANRPRTKGMFGFYVYDITAQKPVYGVGQDEYMSVASCLKLITAVAGMKLLGTNYMFRTGIYCRGNVIGDTLKGDIAFRGRMDPQLKPEDMDMFAKALRKAGIKKFTGKLVMDLAMREPVKSEQHWYPWDLSFSSYGILYKGEDKLRKALLRAMRNRGITVGDGQVVDGVTTTDYRCLLRFNRPLRPVIKRMLKNSSNTNATSLLYAIGYKLNPKGDYAATGVQYLRNFCSKELGVKDKRLVIHDGCGLCTYNHLSSRVLVDVLCYANKNKDIYNMVNSCLSWAGVDGTLMRLLNNPKFRGNIRGKTGTLSHPYGISSLAGYARGADGHLLAFAIMDNDMSVLDARVLQRRLCETLVK